MRRSSFAVVAVLGLCLAGLYFVAIDLHDPNFTLQQQQHVIDGTGGSPYRYRVLVPFLIEGGTRLLAFVGPPPRNYLAASLVYDVVAWQLQLVALLVLLRTFFAPRLALLGVVFTAGVSVLTLAYFTFQPWSILEVALFAFGFVCAYRQRWGWLSLVVVLASLNRETGVFLPLAVFLASIHTLHGAIHERDTQRAFGLLVLSTAIFAGLRLVRGSVDPVDPLPEVIARNFEPNNVRAAGFAIPLVLGVGWVYAVLGLRSAPPFVQRLARVVPCYLVAFAIWGWWREVRILTSLYPVLVPLVLAYCLKGQATD